MKKRFLAMFLALALCMGLAVPAFAALPPETADEGFKNVTWEYTLGSEQIGNIKAGPSVEKNFNIAWYGDEDMKEGTLSGYRAVRDDTEFTLRFDKSDEDDNSFIQICIAPYVYYGTDKYNGRYMWEESPRTLVLTPDGEFDYNINATESKLVRAGESVQFKLPTIYAYGAYNPATGGSTRTEMSEVIYRLEFRKYYPDTAYEVPGMHGPETAYKYLYQYGNFKVDNAAVDSYLKENPTQPVTPADPKPTAPAFTDVPSWFEKEVAWAAEKGITNGYGGNDKFAPGIDCTQAQILTFLWRAEDKPQAAKAPIIVASYYQDAINWAYEEGLIDASFNPDAPCTRAQAVQYIWQALGKKEAKTAASFSDVAADAPYADAVSWAVEKGVTKGYGGSDTFAPDRVCSRGEIAAFLYRAYND